MRQLATGLALMVVALGVSFALAGPQEPQGKAADDPAAELKTLQGKWERSVDGDAQKDGIRRMVKEVSENKETVTFYGENDAVLRKHTAEFKLERRQGVRIFTFFNMTIHDGADSNKVDGPISYIYRVGEDNFTEAWGLLPGQEGIPVQVLQWKKAKNS